MRKQGFCICENKDADQLRANRKADQRICFRYIDSTITLLPKYEISSLAILCGFTAWFVWDLVGNPEDRFSHNEAHILQGEAILFIFRDKELLDQIDTLHLIIDKKDRSQAMKKYKLKRCDWIILTPTFFLLHFQFPYPPGTGNDPTRTLKSLVNIRKDSLKLVRLVH